MKKRINVIIPSFNCGKFIEHCLLSVFSQLTEHRIILIISNDCSTDNTSEILERIKKTYRRENFEIEIFNQEKNLGEINNTKFLLERCTGDYVAYLDADDFWIDPNTLDRQINFLEENGSYSMCCCGYLQYDEGTYIPVANGGCWLSPPLSIDIDNPITSEMLISTNFIGSSSRVFRNYKNLILDYFYDFPFSDWPLNFELSLLGDIKFINLPTYCYRIHRSSLSFVVKEDPSEDLEKYKKRVNLLKQRYELYGKIL